MRRWNWQDARGMTLLELMIVVAIMAIVMGSIFAVFMTSLRAYWKGDLNVQVQQGARVAADHIIRDLRAARRLCNTGPVCPPQGGFQFNVAGGGPGCTTPQISFVLPHVQQVALVGPYNGNPNPQAFITDTDGAGNNPYDGWYVSYYLAPSPDNITVPGPGTTPTAPAPNTTYYLKKTVWDLKGLALSTVTIANNIGGLSLPNVGCPVASGLREVTLSVTAYQQSASQNAMTSTDTVTVDISLRNL